MDVSSLVSVIHITYGTYLCAVKVIVFTLFYRRIELSHF